MSRCRATDRHRRRRPAVSLVSDLGHVLRWSRSARILFEGHLARARGEVELLHQSGVALSMPVATRHNKDRPGGDSRYLATFVGPSAHPL
jgi:hypothetical protein